MHKREGGGVLCVRCAGGGGGGGAGGRRREEEEKEQEKGVGVMHGWVDPFPRKKKHCRHLRTPDSPPPLFCFLPSLVEGCRHEMKPPEKIVVGGGRGWRRWMGVSHSFLETTLAFPSLERKQRKSTFFGN